MKAIKSGVRELSFDLAGYFSPTQGEKEADIAALKNASQTLDRLLAAQGVDAESVLADFKAARQRANRGTKKLGVQPM